MIRLPLMIAGGLVAAAAAATPAIAGLTGNPSFSQQVPVRVPARATVATFPTATAVGHEHNIERRETEPRRRSEPDRRAGESDLTPLISPRRSEPEPGDDRSRSYEDSIEAGDDRGGGQRPEPGDDRGPRGGRRGRDDG